MVSLTSPVSRPVGLTATFKTPMPVAARPSLHRKRTSTQAGMDDIASTATNLSQQSPKRSKVQFDANVEIYSHQDGQRLDFLREQVSRALNRHKVFGDSKEYSAFKQVFAPLTSTPNSSSDPPRRLLLQALCRVAAALDNSTTDLVSTVLDSDWISEDDGYVEIFARFATLLISARSSWVSAVLDMLVGKFSRPLHATSTDSRIFRKEAELRVHRIISEIIKVAPLDGTASLKRSLVKNFPGTWDSSKAVVLYVHNLLKTAEYAPQLESEILALITDRVVKIDVQVQNDVEDIEDLEEMLFENAPEELDAFVDLLEDDEDEMDEADITDDAGAGDKAKAIRKEIQKMDLLLDMLFDYHSQAVDSTGAIRDDAYDLLESLFDRIILPAYRSRHTQFLIFHFAQSSLEMVDRFVGDCLMRAMDRNRPALVRHSAAAYLASFVARGARVPTQVVRDVFGFIGNELLQMREEYEPKCQGKPDLRRFGVYYSLVQALLYIFCFRWKDLEVTPSDPGSSPEPYNSATVIHQHEIHAQQQHIFIPKVRETLSRNVLSPLNPLKICAPVITEEFARVANSVGILYVYSKLEENKRIRLVQTNMSVLGRESALSTVNDQGVMQLDAYFPFDPYNLPRSKRWLADDYRPWQSPPGYDDDDESNSDADEEDEDEDLSDAEDE